MGPTIIVDKSTLQSLSQIEIEFLFKHYYVVVSRVLILEILGDLKKKPRNRTSEEEVRILANKLLSIDSIINAHYYVICLYSLSGFQVPMNGQAFVTNGIALETRLKGDSGVFLDEQIERESLRNWQDGNFTQADKLLAQDWRNAIKSIDLETERKRVSYLFRGLPKFDDLSEIDIYLNRILSRPDSDTQFMLIGGLMDALNINQRIKDFVFDRWLKEGLPSFKDFAPYAFYCYRVLSSFLLGLFSNLITTKSTNRIDLEYLFYLPFCIVFSSNDNFHAKISKLLLRRDQFFVDSKTLKCDLNWLSNEWEKLSESEKEDRAYNYGSYPPNNPMSITNQIWQKTMRPWKPGSGNRASRMTEEERKKIIESFKPIFNEIDRVKKEK